MIKKFVNFIKENYKTGYFNYNDRPFNLDVSYDDEITNVKIIYMGKYYEDLSIIVPDSDNLDVDEFFVNPHIDEKIIKELKDQGFIECTNKISMAGDKKTKSYKLV